ncbi:potassium transporter TrkA [Campylobacterota bacterium]|nr:potassium transporter TrkA [Campylobacterota bacterium]
MKKLMIIADGDVARRFVNRVCDTYSDVNLFDIIYYNDSIEPNDAIHCRFHKFDPTSFTKLEAVFSHQIYTAYIVMREKIDIEAVYQNLRILGRDLMIYVLDDGNLELKDSDEHLRRIKSGDLLANRLMTVVPNIPVSAQYVGLGQGEIIEAKVPFGSSFAYRHIGSIEQKKWQIAAIYRNEELILPSSAFLLRPGDNIVLVGQPSILKNIYKAIKIESGQFPAPFGRNIYLILDLSKKRLNAADEIDAAISLHKRIKNKVLFIKVLNPDHLELLEKLRTISNGDIMVDISYKQFDFKRDLTSELARLNVGLVVVSDEVFSHRHNREILFNTRRAIWKLGVDSVKELRKAGLLLTANPDLEQIGSAMFDLSAQLSLSILIFPSRVDPEGEEPVLEHFENLSQVHTRAIKICNGEENPIFALRKEVGALLFFPFDRTMIERSVFDLLRPRNSERLWAVVANRHQLFIPVLEEMK